VRAICWIVPKKYLLLLDQTILLHYDFRSSIDRPLNLPQYPRRKYIINNWGLMKIFYFGWSGVYSIVILHLYITATCRHTIVFYGKYCFSNIKTRYVFDVIVTSWALFVFCISWNFARDISTVFEEIKHLRSRAPDNILPNY
jgi:hypothetical protein